MASNQKPVELWLERVHMRSVGPPKARFDPLDLRFDAPGGIAERVLLSLTNGGGKTTWIRLLSSLLVPNARQQVGRANIAEYVGDGDTSHIVTEWGTADGDRLLLGAVYEWPNRSQPAGAPIGQLKRNWYLFRSSDATIDDLPFDIIDGQGRRRRRTLADFNARLHELDPARLVAAQSQSEWAEALASGTPLDTELFRYQMRMNDSEAGAGKFIEELNSADKLVRFFVEVLCDDADLEAFEATLTKYAATARNRAHYEAERGFFGAIGDALGEFADRHDDLVDARRKLVLREQESAVLGAAVVARIAADSAQAEELAARRENEEAERVRLGTEVRVREFRAAELRYIDAQLVETTLRTELAYAETEEEATRLDRDAWEAVPKVHDHQRAVGRFNAAERAFLAADGKLAPLVEQHEQTGADLAAKLRDLAATAEADARQADADAQQAEQDAAAAQAAVSAATTKLADARRNVTDAAAKVDKLAEIAERLLRDGHLNDGEGPSAGVARHAATLESLDLRIVAAAGKVNDAEARTGQAREDQAAALAELARRRVTLDTALTRRTSFDVALGRVASDPGVAELTDAPLAGLDEASRLVPFAEQSATERELDAASARREIAELEGLILRVGSGGLAPTAADIEAVRAALDSANVAVTTGFEWIAENVDGSEREQFVADHPELANAVVVISVPAHPGGIGGVLADAGIELRSVVPLVTPQQMACPTPAVDDSNEVALPDPAVYDQNAAGASVEKAEHRRDDLVLRADELGASAGRLRGAVAALSGFVDEWSPHPPEALDTGVEAAQRLVGEAEAEVTAAQDATHDAATADRTAREAVKTLETARNNARVSRTACAGGVDIEADANEASTRLPHLQRAVISVKDELDRADHDREWHSTLHLGGVTRAEQSRAAAASYNTEQEGVGIPPADIAPDDPLTELRSLFRALAAEVTQRRTESGHESERREAQTQLASAEAALDQLPPQVRELAGAHAATAEAGDRLALTGRRTAATQAWQAALERKTRADTGLRVAADKVAELKPQERQRHAVLPEEWDVSSREGVELLLSLNEEELAGLRAHASRRAQNVADLDERVNALRGDVDRLTKFALPAVEVDADADVTAAPFPGTVDEALAAATETQAAYRQAETATSAADRSRTEALYWVRDVALDTRWDNVTSPLRATCQRITADGLAVEARVNVTRAAVRVKATTDQLGELDEHRELLAAQLADLCDSQRRMLRNVEKTSQLPTSLGGELSGQPVFKIRFEPLPAQEIAVALRGKVDIWAVELGDGTRVDRERRLGWLTDALHATVKSNATRSPWRVQVIKPVTDGHPDWHPAERISKEYSGGQELTLAVLLYCTLAAVRGANRQSGSRPPGVLVLDNPFGAASNPQLLRMQHELAKGLGIQLICATGLDDPNVLTSFNGEHGVVVRMRGDTARGEPFKYLRVVDPAGEHLVSAQAAVDPDFDGTLFATTYTIRTGSP